MIFWGVPEKCHKSCQHNDTDITKYMYMTVCHGFVGKATGTSSNQSPVYIPGFFKSLIKFQFEFQNIKQDCVHIVNLHKNWSSALLALLSTQKRKICQRDILSSKDILCI